MSTSQKRTVSRRSLLRGGLAGFSVLALGGVERHLGRGLEAMSGVTKRLIVLNLLGGNDGLNSVVPVTLSPYAERRPNIAIDPKVALSMDVGPYATTSYRMHPALANLAQLWSEGNVAVIQKVGYPDPNLSHFFSMDIWSRGARSATGFLGSGWIARFKDLYAPDPIHVVGLGTRLQLDFAGGKTQSVVVQSLDEFKADADPKYAANSRFRRQIMQELLRTHTGRGHELNARDSGKLSFEMEQRLAAALAKYRSTVAYPNTGVAQRLRDAAVLMQAGFPTKLIYTIDGGYDTHANQGGVSGRHCELLTRADRAIGAFAADLKAMGAWRHAAIAVVSEFGRRNYENGSHGTDHGTSNTLFVIGGAVRGGVYGPGLAEKDLLGKFPEYEVDFRQIYKELLGRHLGVDPAPVFPERQAKDGTLGFVL